MSTAFVTHPACLAHLSGTGHPERPERLSVIQDRLMAGHLFTYLHAEEDPPRASAAELERVHTARHVRELFAHVPATGTYHLDRDTVMDPSTPEAAFRAAGSVIRATDLVLGKEVRNAFCSIRPPGHHATRDAAMGLCFFNNVAVGAAHALAAGGLERVAVVDFDAHRGNGTEDIFHADPRVLFCSVYQRNLFPVREEHEAPGRAVEVELDPGAGGQAFRAAVRERWDPALEAFQPQMIFLSAGFDAHAADAMSDLTFSDDDFVWISEWAVALANRFAGGRLVSVLEGGYELTSLGRCAALHVRALLEI